jgi:hypothetical protein
MRSVQTALVRYERSTHQARLTRADRRGQIRDAGRKRSEEARANPFASRRKPAHARAHGKGPDCLPRHEAAGIHRCRSAGTVQDGSRCSRMVKTGREVHGVSASMASASRRLDGIRLEHCPDEPANESTNDRVHIVVGWSFAVRSSHAGGAHADEFRRPSDRLQPQGVVLTLDLEAVAAIRQVLIGATQQTLKSAQ